jgi:hypothetical protein
MQDPSRKVIEILSAVAAVDLTAYPVWRSLERGEHVAWASLDQHPIYAEAADVTLTGDRFSVDAEIHYQWECTCHGMSGPDVQPIWITGRFINGSPIIEEVVRKSFD